MRCSSCGSKDISKSGDYYICAYCGSKTEADRKNLPRILSVLVVVVVFLFVFYTSKMSNKFSHEVGELPVTKQSNQNQAQNYKSTIKINNTRSDIGVQSIVIDDNPSDLSIDNTDAKIGAQSIRRTFSKEKKETEETIQGMHKVAKILHTQKTKEKVAHAYQKYYEKKQRNLYKDSSKPRSKSEVKLLNYSYTKIDNNGKVLEEISHSYGNEDSKESARVTSLGNAYKVNNKNSDVESQKVLYSQEGNRRFLSVETH